MNNKHQLKLTQLIPLLACLGSTPTIVMADVVHLDDVIIQFSLCTGNDCVNGESFGFDTMRLKENNLRMHFNDTSTSASFPSNDWRFIFNDSSNGGDNYFALEDSTAGRQPFRVDAGAPANALRVDSAGDVGIGTSNPVVDVHVASGNTPTLRLEQNGSSGFTSQTWDMAGNEANFFIRDVTNGSKLPFKIKPAAPTSSLFIAADGDIGFGTESPDSHIDIEDTTPELRLTGTTSGIAWEMRMNGAGNLNFQQATSGNNVVSIGATANSNLLQVGRNANDEVTINGNLVILAGTCTAPGGDANCGADYVFEPDYKKPSLEELKDFVTTNKHLPNIPTAADMTKNGIKLTELSVQLLAKVEELTLYTIDQQDIIKQLQARIEKLEGDS